MFHLVEPRRITLVEEKLIGVFKVAILAQHARERGSTEESCGEVSHSAHILSEPSRRFGAQGIREEIEVERQHVSRLGVGGEPTGGRDVLALKRGANALEQRAIIPRVLTTSQYLGCAGEQVGGVREVRSCDEVLVGRRARVVSASRLEGEPVAEMETLLPEKTVARLRPLVLDPRAHTR